MKKMVLVSAVVLVTAAAGLADAARKHSLEGAWELVSGQPLPPGARDLKVISGGHVIFVAYDAEKGTPLYTGGGTYTLSGNSYTEHLDFASEPIAALIGQDQSFTVKLDGDTFIQSGTLSNGKPLREIWRRLGYLAPGS